MKEIKGLIKEMLGDEGMEDLALLLKIREGWGDVAGEEFANRAIPYRLEGERLLVGVSSHAVAQEIHFMEGKIVSNLHGMGIKRIKKVIARKVNLNKRFI